MMLLITLLGTVIILPASALDDGLARTPPMGWRSWNAFTSHINQSIMQQAMDEMVKKGPNGLSLLDVGYSDVGLDDYWQACGEGERGFYHAKDGSPIVNTKLFPNLTAMVAYGHHLNLKVGWYANNCYCAESGFSDAEIDLHQQMDVKATLEYAFDSIKLDGCGQQNNLTRWVELFRHASPTKPIMIENCHWGADLATPDWCPYHFARTSPDVTPGHDVTLAPGQGVADWALVWLNMQTMGRTNGFARPGCWNYADMLETGNFMGKDQKLSEGRATFGMWAIASSPLILSYDLRDQVRSSRVWDVITNRDAIAVNQAWAGDAGRLVYSWDPTQAGQQFFVWSEFCDDFSEAQNGWFFDDSAEEIKFNTGDDSENDLCLDMQPGLDPSFATLTQCHRAKRVRFLYKPSGQIMDMNGQCLMPFHYQHSTGPGFVLGKCANYTDLDAWDAQHFSLGMKARNNRINHQNGYCLAARSSAPMNSNAVQLWAKRIRGMGKKENAFHALTGSEHMPHISKLMDNFKDDDQEAALQAVLVVNADKHSVNTLEFNSMVIAKLFGPDANGKNYLPSVYDVWAQKLLPLGEDEPFVVSVQPRDSAFLVLKLLKTTANDATPRVH